MTAAAEQRPTLAGFFRPYVGNLVALMALTVVLSVLAMLPPLLVREVIDGVVTEGRHDLLTALTVAMIAVHVATAACQYGIQCFLNKEKPEW